VSGDGPSKSRPSEFWRDAAKSGKPGPAVVPNGVSKSNKIEYIARKKWETAFVCRAAGSVLATFSLLNQGKYLQIEVKYLKSN
jgi:hypothetical protein